MPSTQGRVARKPRPTTTKQRRKSHTPIAQPSATRTTTNKPKWRVTLPQTQTPITSMAHTPAPRPPNPPRTYLAYKPKKARPPQTTPTAPSPPPPRTDYTASARQPASPAPATAIKQQHSTAHRQAPLHQPQPTQERHDPTTHQHTRQTAAGRKTQASDKTSNPPNPD